MNLRVESTTVTVRQAVALLAGLLLVAGAVTAAAVMVKPGKARAFDLFHGSLFLADDRAPVAVDLTNGTATVRLLQAFSQVSARSDTDLGVAPLTTGTLLYNRRTAEFNMVDAAGFVVKTKGGGVPLPAVDGQNGTQVIASGSSAYVIQNSPSRSGIYLVSQVTVESARGAKGEVKPRASLILNEGSTGAAESAVSANGDLWLLTGTAGTDAGDTARTVHLLGVPDGSEAGAILNDEPMMQVQAASALGTSLIEDMNAYVSAPNGPVESVNPSREVGVATPDGITVYRPAGESGKYDVRSVGVPGLGSADRIVATSGARGALLFLYHLPGAGDKNAGWFLVTVDDGDQAVVKKVGDIAAQAGLVKPGFSGGALFTADSASGALWRIDSTSGVARPVQGMEAYPVVTDDSGKAQETADYDDVYVTVRGSRVVVNSPNHRRAVVVFTDGSREPALVDKSAAVDLNAAGGAAEIADKQADETQAGPSPAPTPDIAPSAPEVNTAVECANSDQIPHIPVISSLTPASRSVLMAWDYPLLDSQDCAPSTYTVTVKVTGGEAPPAPGSVTVQGQAGVNLVGLYPNTRYEVAVTAYINKHGTSSDTVPFTTGPEGPTAASGVSASTDSTGNWNIAWHSCGGITNTCLPAAQWTVIPSYCDGLGLSLPPSSVTLSGDDTLSSFSTLFGGDATTLGRGLTFQVQGVAADGTTGITSVSTGCTYSWTPPLRAAFSVVASAPPVATFGQKTTSTVTLNVSGDPNVAGGGTGYSYEFQLLSGGAVVASSGATQETTVTFGDITVSKTYKAKVIVTPPRHPEAAITIGPVEVEKAISAWPDLTADAPSVTNTSTYQSKISIQLHPVTSANSNGEKFDIDTTLVCGSTTMELTSTSVDPADPVKFAETVNRLDLNGSCVLRDLTLTQAGGNYFGSSPSPPLNDVAVTLASPTWTATTADFTAKFDDSASQATLTYNAGSPAFAAAHNFTVTVHNCASTDIDSCDPATDGAACGSLTVPGLAPTPAQFTVALSHNAACKDPYGGPRGNWVMEISYDFFLAHTDFDLAHHNSIAISGTPPTAGAPTPTPTPSPTPTPTPAPTP